MSYHPILYERLIKPSNNELEKIKLQQLKIEIAKWVKLDKNFRHTFTDVIEKVREGKI